MTEQDLLAWGLEHYFSVIPWAVDRAKKILEEQGMDAAVECLRRICVDGGHGSSGPDHSSYSTSNGKVHLWGKDKRWGDAELEYDLAKFCRWKLESLYQERLL